MLAAVPYEVPDVIDGAIAASALIWQLAETVERETLDMQAVAITRGALTQPN